MIDDLMVNFTVPPNLSLPLQRRGRGHEHCLPPRAAAPMPDGQHWPCTKPPTILVLELIDPSGKGDHLAQTPNPKFKCGS
jgi:hypothetical protein